MGNKYIIITDSTTDLSEEFINTNNLEILPFRYYIDNKEYKDETKNREINISAFYSKLRSGYMATTSQLNSVDIIEFYTPYLEEGYDILGICFSSGLSGTYNSVRLALEELKEKYSERQVFVVDSKCASMGEGLLVKYAIDYKNEGYSLEQNYQAIEDLKMKVNHWFTVSDIDFLKRGGRVSSVSAFVAKTININPILHVDNDGKLIPRMKKIGRKNALKSLVEKMLDTMDKSYLQNIFISHGDCLSDALYVKTLIEEKISVKEVVISTIGPVIGSHSGPGTVALFFVGQAR